MKNTHPGVDAYIEKSAEFARPILTRLRKLFHKACPQIEEKIKWGVPSFEYKGIVGGIAAFKSHVSFGFWKSKLMKDPAGLFGDDPKASMCNARITRVSELPPDKVLIGYIKEAVDLNERGVKLPTAAKKTARRQIKVPEDLRAALRKSKKAQSTFESFSYSHRKEYVEWITEAKREDTRKRRIATAVEWMAQGKPRNWKYMRK